MLSVINKAKFHPKVLVLVDCELSFSLMSCTNMLHEALIRVTEFIDFNLILREEVLQSALVVRLQTGCV